MPSCARPSFAASDVSKPPGPIANSPDQDQPEPDDDTDAVSEEAQMVLCEVFRDLCFSALHFGPPSPPPHWGLEEPVRMTTRPPRSVVRVVMRTSDRKLERRGRRRAMRARVIEDCGTSDDPVVSWSGGREWRLIDSTASSWHRDGVA